MQKRDRLLPESKKPAGLGSLFDSIYREKLKDSGGDTGAALDSFNDEALLYAGGKGPDLGSSRLVIGLRDGEHVMKLARNEAGFAQNGIEAVLGNDDEVASIVVPVTSTSDVVDHDGFLWIISKKIVPLSISGAGKEWQRFRANLKDAATGNIPDVAQDKFATAVDLPPRAAARRAMELSATTPDRPIFEKGITKEFYEAFAAMIDRYPNLNTADLYKPDSWGLDGNELKLLDGGFTTNIRNMYYEKSPAAAGLFFDPDKAKLARGESQKVRKSKIDARLSDNETIARAALGQPDFPEETALLFYLRGLIPLPPAIEKVASPGRLTAFDLKQAATSVDDNYDKVVGYINRASDDSFRDSLSSGLDGILAQRGKVRTEGFLRSFIREHIKKLA